MIIGAASSLLSGTPIDRSARTSAPVASQPAAPEAAGDASDPLASLANFVESAAQSRKAFAEERLKHLKEQMNTLALFNLAPGFLAGHSARMAKELEAAAGDFASSFKTLSDLGAEAMIGAVFAKLFADPALPAAYLDVIDAEAPAPLVMKAEDAETAASFADTARRLRFVVDLAEDAHGDRFTPSDTAQGARESTSRVVDLMARLATPQMAADLPR
ncbi:hypothetical protein [Hoeflea olei]|uniref:Uncharacterized protein n=1 Tax=Hoeflea olei TaxID=1480615 RepID=A0A1C1YYM6_9HYPH|nr:hypothetical protein [Hoeflea olei]OCW58567.1 hypothetical protein AWJ14_05325 [Hoeflea olei]